ncbi:MAG: hypothetical protein II126_06250 [Erysipelotrichaceae bacterium]|nr:hypothetical protein [Erysipelotrichaceae bacterium]
MEKKFNKFSVPLGLLDYVNPVFYTVTMLTVIRNLRDTMQKPYGVMLLAGAVISIFFGFIIPTGKVIVGLGLIRFVMPVSLVLCVNTGIFISGLALLKHVMSLSNLTLILIAVVILSFLGFVYSRRRKLNTVAVLIGAFGYLMIYSSLITLSVQKGLIASVIMYGMAILLFVMLCGIGIKADLKNPKVHWVIEISNVICQGLVALATVLLFGK